MMEWEVRVRASMEPTPKPMPEEPTDFTAVPEFGPVYTNEDYSE